MMRGFSTIVPILIMGTILLSAALLASQDAYSVRLSVLHRERVASADAAAQSCATSVLLRLTQTQDTIVAPQEITLGAAVLCVIERVERFDDRYQIYTSAKVEDAVVWWRTDAYMKDGQIGHVISRKI